MYSLVQTLIDIIILFLSGTEEMQNDSSGAYH